MRLVIDLQGAQSTGSRNRGIGRYSRALAEAMARHAGDHEVWIAVNRAFPDTIDALRAAFDTLIPQSQFVVWESPAPVSMKDSANSWRRQAGEIAREAFLANLQPDLVHVSSLFEGLDDDVLTSVGAFTDGHNTAVTLYDLIPLINRQQYLSNPVVENWYERKLTSMRRAGLWLAISESSRREAIDWLDFPERKVINISTAADPRFRPVDLHEDEIKELRRRYGLSRPFVMYTGGIDRRKNIEGLIGAYSRLPAEIRMAHQLAIVCSARKIDVDALVRHAESHGLSKDELVVTGFVPDDHLLKLYNTCKVFCFPSWHEGFGLPVLEAMQCGVAAIGSDTSSIPEVIGRADALFDPHDETDIASRLYQALTDEEYRQSLAEHGLTRSRAFSWDKCGLRAWEAFEEHHAESKRSRRRVSVVQPKRPRLALLSPLPPARSGIADYSAELLPELARHYDIDVVVDQLEVEDAWVKANCPVRDVEWFEQNASSYDRILYHFGNSTFHRHMFDLLRRYPGTVVLHDFYMSGIVSHMDIVERRAGFWAQALYVSHGYAAVRERFTAVDPTEIIWKYPTNAAVLEHATGVISHSNYSEKLSRQFYGSCLSKNWTVIPLLRRAPPLGSRRSAREELGFGETEFILCSFGMIGRTKLNHRLVEAWVASDLADDPSCRLVFVGDSSGEYGEELQRAIDASTAAERIHITGFASPEFYRQHLSAADAAVQLRTHSRGETSAAVLDCLASALPTIVNANGSMAELPRESVLMLPDEFSDAQLVEALETLRRDKVLRQAVGERARAYVKQHLSPRSIADQYHAAIEHYAANTTQALRGRTIRAVAALEPAHQDDSNWLNLARVVSRNIPLITLPRLLVDASGLINYDGRGAKVTGDPATALKELLLSPPDGFRVEPVYATPEAPNYRYARQFTLRLLNCPSDILEDEPVELRRGDVFLGFIPQNASSAQVELYSELRQLGIKIYFWVHIAPGTAEAAAGPAFAASFGAETVPILAEYCDGFICFTKAVADALDAWLDLSDLKRDRPVQIGWLFQEASLERPSEGAVSEGRHTTSNVGGTPDWSKGSRRLHSILSRGVWPEGLRRQPAVSGDPKTERAPSSVVSNA